ncbi:hypothetical protein BpHYR1_009823 [Brachionus plicatilis]|uniref:RNA-directed DNA polymerase from mobile element jockey-like n=1 Tax=Brachionus plicatilis TaxID=10195 RepID=A0A3M7RX11_BRAPC|nr:hypothetical protein BpHYR1_009823 [Brachionus plicatilis]
MKIVLFAHVFFINFDLIQNYQKDLIKIKKYFGSLNFKVKIIKFYGAKFVYKNQGVNNKSRDLAKSKIKYAMNK